jgi:3-phenylpropionate/trans-cinnamate dioxygenase ferredoxin reductase subunit
MADFDLLIVGGGLASARAIKGYREAGGEGRIALVSKDTSIPYHRPPLSKKFLRGEAERADTFVEPEEFYADNDVELMLETSADSLFPEEHRIELEGGTTYTYGKLLLATGAWPRTLDAPGMDADGVFTLRTLDDSAAIHDAAREAERAVSVGGSFIGMETAASLRQLGLEVTLLERVDSLFPVLGSPELSQELADLYRSNGVELVLGDSVASFRANGRVEAVETQGGRTVPADLVVVGIGVVPQTQWLDGSGVSVDNGIVVDASYRTNLPDVYAAGDVANFEDPVLDMRHRIEHWSNANYQGEQVGKVLAGSDERFDRVSSFFTEVFGVSLRVFGTVTRDHRRTYTGSLAEGKLLILYLDGDRISGAVVVGQDDETVDELQRLIRERAPEAAFTPA